MAMPHMVRTGPPPVPDAGPDEISRRELSAPMSPAPGRTMASADPPDHRSVRSWPLLLLALPASVAVWSGWVGIGRLTGSSASAASGADFVILMIVRSGCSVSL